MLVGMLTRRDLVRALTDGGATRLVESAMQRDYPAASPDDAMDRVLHRLSGGATALPVVRGRQLLGLLTMENVQEFLMLRAADPAVVQSW
jgi:CBS domain-containing protein